MRALTTPPGWLDGPLNFAANQEVLCDEQASNGSTSDGSQANDHANSEQRIAAAMRLRTVHFAGRRV
jgi:hypothetical protein